MAIPNPALYCATCNILCVSSRTLQSHLAGRKHKANLLRGDDPLYRSAGIRCPICDTLVPGGERSWNTHVEGRGHQNRASLNPRHVELPFVALLANLPPGMRRCNACLVIVSEASWDAHTRSGRHQYALKLAAVRGAVQEAEQDKFGVTISHHDGLDMGILDIGSLAASPTANASVTITATDQSIKFVESRTSSSLSPRAVQQHFSVNSIQAQNLSVGRAITARITFDPSGQRGRFQDRIEFVFEDVSLSQQFVISRLVRAVVGVQAELEALKPIAPYVRRDRVTREPEGEVVPGEKPPALKAIPWKIKLEEYPLPDRIENAVKFGTLEEKVARVGQMLPDPVTCGTFGKHWSTLLFVEEAQMKKDIQVYDMRGVPLTRNGGFYHLEVPGLAEKRPSVIVGDKIKVHVQGTAPADRWFEGYVHFVHQAEVGLRFDPGFKYSKGQLCNVRFGISRFPIRRMHQAMDRPFVFDRVLFPAIQHVSGLSRPTSQQLGDVRRALVNELIRDNEPQLLAVTAVKEAAPGSLPFVIWGPPGTGKTITMVEAIRQVLKKTPNARIIACAPSNSAADLIAERLADLTPQRLFRLVAPSRKEELVPDKILPFCTMREVTEKDITRKVFSVPPLAIMKRYNVIVSTCVQSSVPHGVGFPRGHFTHIFVDEAGQGLEPEVMISIKTMAGPNTNIILSGDPKQLGPIIHSDVAKELGFGRSYLERLLDRKAYDQDRYRGISVVKLVKNYRSHPAILRFPNEQFYRGELQTCGSPARINRLAQWSGLPKKGFPVIFHALRGEDTREASSPSFFNPDEASAVKDYINRLRSDRSLRLADPDIGVISPYNAQCRKISKILLDRDGIKVDSTEGYQGQERPVIIISTVRSRPELVSFDTKFALGFVAQPRRLNVAITRAQALLIVIGDPSVLGRDPLWRSFLNYVYVGGGWIGDGPEWDPSELVPVPVEGMEELQSRLREMTLAGDGEPSGADGDADNEREDAQADRPWWRDGEE